MLSLESSADPLRKVLLIGNQDNAQDVEVACFNSQSAHILVGSNASIKALESKIEDCIESIGAVKYRRLRVTHGFHSHLVDPILPGLAKLAHSIDLHEPRIPIETCSKEQSWTQIDAESITRHSREPVYFVEAVNGIARERGSCNWIEARTNSGITGMVRQALMTPKATKDRFHAISLTSESGVQPLTDATVSLWQSGVKVQFWPYHRLQRHEYEQIFLPPYRFDKHKHWLERRLPSATASTGDQEHRQRSYFMHGDSLLENIGLDSLMTVEVLGELEKTFKANITMSELYGIRDLSSLSSHVQAEIARRFGAVLTPLEPAIKSEVKTRLQRSDSFEIFSYKKTAETDDRVDGGKGVPLIGQITSISSDTRISPPKVLECFDIVRRELSHIMDETQLTGFIKCVSPVQAQLVCTYIVEAFEDLGCSLSGLKEGESVSVPSTPQRAALMKQLHMILESSSLHRTTSRVQQRTPCSANRPTSSARDSSFRDC